MFQSKTEVDGNVLRNEMYLPLRIDEGILLKIALSNHLKQMKSGDDRDIVRKVFERLSDMVFDITCFQTKSF